MSMPEEDLVEERLSRDLLDPMERDPEAPPEDAFEQTIPVDPTVDPVEVHRGLEVDEYDALEQAQVVDLDEDYR